MPPFRTILFAADFEDNSKEAFRMACSLAVEDKTRLFVLHVAEPTLVSEEPVSMGQPSMQFFNAERAESLERKLREVYVPAHSIDMEYRTSEGGAAEEVLRMADEIGADLIVMGTHGRTGLRRLLAGSVATAVLRGARCAVLALRTHARSRDSDRIRVILHPTDSSDGYETVQQVARSLARDLGAKLVLLHVVPFAVFPSELAVPVDLRAYRDVMEAVREHLDGPDLKYPVEARLGQGDAAAEILKTARELGCDLIVMGSQGRTGLDRLLLGSVAESVLARADCPVMIVRVPRSASAPTPSAGEKTMSVP